MIELSFTSVLDASCAERNTVLAAGISSQLVKAPANLYGNPLFQAHIIEQLRLSS